MTPSQRPAGPSTARRLVQAGVGCWAVGELSILGLGGRDAWRALLGWAVVAAVVALAARRLGPVARAVGASVLVPLCVLLALEGGLVFLPAAVAVTAAAAAALPRGRRPVG